MSDLGDRVNVMGPQRQKYDPGTVDYFAILLIPIDDWYIVPFEVMGRTNSSIHFTPEGVRQKYRPSVSRHPAHAQRFARWTAANSSASLPLRRLCTFRC